MSEYISSLKQYKLNLPDDWIFEEDNECVSFSNPQKGVGVIQISSYTSQKKQAIDARSILLEYLEDHNISIDKDDIDITENENKSVVGYTYIKEGKYWIVRVIIKFEKLLFVTYNCDVANKDIEHDDVELIIKSINID